MNGTADSIARLQVYRVEIGCLRRLDFEIEKQVRSNRRGRVGDHRLQHPGLEGNGARPQGLERRFDRSQGLVTRLESRHGLGLTHHESVAEKHRQGEYEQRDQSLEECESPG